MFHPGFDPKCSPCGYRLVCIVRGCPKVCVFCHCTFVNQYVYNPGPQCAAVVYFRSSMRIVEDRVLSLLNDMLLGWTYIPPVVLPNMHLFVCSLCKHEWARLEESPTTHTSTGVYRELGDLPKEPLILPASPPYAHYQEVPSLPYACIPITQEVPRVLLRRIQNR